MRSRFLLCLLSFLVQSARSDFSQGLGNIVGRAYTQKSAGVDPGNADSNAVHHGTHLRREKVADAAIVQLDSSMPGLNMKSVSNELNSFLAPNSHLYDREQMKKNTDNVNDIHRGFESLKKKRLQKKYQMLKKNTSEKNTNALSNKENKRIETEQSEIKHILSENNILRNDDHREDSNLFELTKSIAHSNMKLRGDQMKSLAGKPTKLKEKDWSEIFEPQGTQPTLLENEYFDDSDNLIDDDDHENEIKRLKKNLWLENLIPKSNKFLYKNKKYRDHLEHDSHTQKYEQWKDSYAAHNRSKRSVLSSIFVQMPHGDDEDPENPEESLMDNEESRDKKSKGSTTVCLEIKSDPTKPPSTICGPEIKPNLPFDYHMYSLGNQNFAPNSLYYPEPQVDRTIWSMNPLHDPMSYSPSNFYKHQTANKNQRQHKHNNNNGVRSGLKSTSQLMPSDMRYSTPSDKNYQSKENSLTQNPVSPEDKAKPLKTMPVATDYLHRDTYGKEQSVQTPRNMLSGKNNEKHNDALGVARNNFQDLDLNLDGETSSNTYNYLNPEIRSFNEYDSQYDPTYGRDVMNSLNSSPMFYPLNNYDANDRIFKVSEEAEQDGGPNNHNQQQMPNEEIVELGLEEKPKDPVQGANNSADILKSADSSSDEIFNPEVVDSREPTDRYLNTAGSTFKNSYGYYPDSSFYNYYPDRFYPYRPTVYPYVPSRPYSYRPYQDYYPYEEYDPYCRSGRCKSAEITNEANFRGVPQTSSINDLAVLPFQSFGDGDQNTDNIFMNTFTPTKFQPRAEETFKSIPIDVNVPEFRGDSYYSGRPYPYRPTYEYQGYQSYPYSSRPYPYRPSGYSYPYNPNCRTADGRSCRDADERIPDDSVSSSISIQNYMRPNVQENRFYEPKQDESDQSKGEYRSMNFETNPVVTPLQFQSRPTMNSANLQITPSQLLSGEILGNPPPLFKTSSSASVNSENLQETQSQLLSNEILGNSPLLFRTSSSVPLNAANLQETELQYAAAPSGNEYSFLGNPPPLFRTSVPVASHATPALVPAGLPCNVVHAPVLIPQSVIPSAGLSGFGAGHGHLHHHGGVTGTSIGGYGHVSGVGTHGIPFKTGLSGPGTHGFHGLSTGRTNTFFSGVGTHGIGGSHGLTHHHLLKESNHMPEEVKDSKELKEDFKEKETKAKSTDIKKETNVKSKPKPSVEEVKSRIEEKLKAAEDKLQSSKSAILEKINKNISKEKKVNEDKENASEKGDSKETLEEPESRGTFNSPAILQLPSGGRISYNSGLANIPMMFGRATPGSSSLNFPMPLGGSITYDPPLYGNGQTGFGPKPCSGNNLCSSSMINPSQYNFQRSMPVSPFNWNSYMPLNTPIVGASLIGSPGVFNSPLPRLIESDVKSANMPFAQNRPELSEIVGSSFDLNVQLPQQNISPAAKSYHQYPDGISFSAPTPGSLQYQNYLNTFPNAHTKPMFASLAELKARDREMKLNYPGNSFDQNEYNKNYNELIYKASEELKLNGNILPSSKKSEGNVEIENLKSPALIKPDLKPLTKLPSKILTAKPLIPPAPILKSPKTIAKGSSSKTALQEPCT